MQHDAPPTRENAHGSIAPERSYSGKDELENTIHDDICSGTVPLRQAQRQIAHNWVALARRDGITPKTTPAPTLTPTSAPAPSSPPSSSSAPTGDKDCSDFSTHNEAQQYFDSHSGSASNDFDRLDGNHVGVACSSLP